MAKFVASSTLGTPPDTYLYSVTRSGNVFATIGSDDSLRTFDISLQPSKHNPSVHTGVTCLQAHENNFITAGRDGLIRYWDSRTTRSTLEIRDPKSHPISSTACRGHYIAAGNESAKEGLGDVSVILYDTRNASTPLRNYAESHTDTITQLAFHPSESNVLLSGSTDGLVSFFDVNVQDEDDALQRVLNPRSAVHCAGFLNDKQVYISTMDEQFCIHDLDGPDEASVLDFGDVRDKLDCMYIVNVINAAHPMIACGHNVNQTLSLVELDRSRAYAFGGKVDLPGAHGDDVVRDLVVLDRECKAISCGEDGRIRLWDLAGAMGAGEAMSVD